MSINVSENTLAVWHASMKDGDFIAALNKVGDKLRLEYRFREYVDDKVWDSADRKRFYYKEADNTQENIDLLFAIMRTGGRAFSDDFEEVVRGDKTFKQFSEEFLMMDGLHFQGHEQGVMNG